MIPDGRVAFENLRNLLIIKFHMQPSEADRMELCDVWGLLDFAVEMKRPPAMTRAEFNRKRKKLDK